MNGDIMSRLPTSCWGAENEKSLTIYQRSRVETINNLFGCFNLKEAKRNCEATNKQTFKRCTFNRRNKDLSSPILFPKIKKKNSKLAKETLCQKKNSKLEFFSRYFFPSFQQFVCGFYLDPSIWSPPKCLTNKTEQNRKYKTSLAMINYNK